MDNMKRGLVYYFLVVPLGLVLVRLFFISLMFHYPDTPFPLNLFILIVIISIYLYPLVQLLRLKKGLENSNSQLLRLELYAGLGARLSIIDNFILLATNITGFNLLTQGFKKLFGITDIYISFITPNMFSGVGPTTYFEYSSIYLGYLYEFISGDKFFMYRNYAWLAPRMIFVSYILIFSLLVLGLLVQRLSRPIIVISYLLALLNDLFPLVLPFLQAFLYGGWYDYHGFATMSLIIYIFFQLIYLRFNLRRLIELPAPGQINKIDRFFDGQPIDRDVFPVHVVEEELEKLIKRLEGKYLKCFSSARMLDIY